MTTQSSAIPRDTRDLRTSRCPASAESRHDVLPELHLANAPATEHLGRPLSIGLIASMGPGRSLTGFSGPAAFLERGGAAQRPFAGSRRFCWSVGGPTPTPPRT